MSTVGLITRKCLQKASQVIIQIYDQQLAAKALLEIPNEYHKAAIDVET
jgi:hypothetical protein